MITIRVCRKLRFKHTQHDALLCIYELQELESQSRSTDNNEEYLATVMSEQTSELLPSWYEVGITCPTIDQILQSNQSLSLGDEADWQPDDLSNFAENIFRPACQMLKQMDGIGFYNNNGYKIEDFVPAPIPVPPEVFW